MFKKITDSVSTLLFIFSFYIIFCLVDIITTTPIKDKIKQIMILNKSTGETIEVINNPNYKKPFNVDRNNSLIVINDVIRYRTAVIKTERKIKELDDDSIFSISVINKNVFPEHISLKSFTEIPIYLRPGCKLFFLESYYEYSYNLLTTISPIKVNLDSFSFCLTD